jgi:hypothetical protein
MAGNQNSGGPRPTAPQNNPANVNALGGNGQSGRGTQAPKYISGMAYGQGQATMAQQAGAPMAGPTPNAAQQVPDLNSLSQVTSVTEPTQRPNEPVTAGGAMGPGPGIEALTMPKPVISDNSAFNAKIDAYAPVLEFIASQSTTSQETRDVISLLIRGRENQ